MQLSHNNRKTSIDKRLYRACKY